MLMSSSSFLVQIVAAVLLLFITLTMTSNIPEPTSFVAEMSQSYHHGSHPTTTTVDSSDDQDSYDESSNEDEYEHDFSKILSKRYSNKVLHGGNSATTGDARLWAIPYRFGKRAAMPYRFGKRAGMHFRLG